jgi:hypothetical protein
VTLRRPGCQATAQTSGAQQFPMRNKDVIYASNAESVEVVKFIAYANYITASVAGL